MTEPTKRKVILPPDPDETLNEAAMEVAVAVKLLLANGAEVIELTEETRRTTASHTKHIWLDEKRLVTEWVAVDRKVDWPLARREACCHGRQVVQPGKRFPQRHVFAKHHGVHFIVSPLEFSISNEQR